MITQPRRWGEGWGMDERGVPYRLVDGYWIEQAPIGQTLGTPMRIKA